LTVGKKKTTREKERGEKHLEKKRRIGNHTPENTGKKFVKYCGSGGEKKEREGRALPPVPKERREPAGFVLEARQRAAKKFWGREKKTPLPFAAKYIPSGKKREKKHELCKGQCGGEVLSRGVTGRGQARKSKKKGEE